MLSWSFLWSLAELLYFVTGSAVSESMLLVTSSFLSASKMQKSCLDDEKVTKMYK